MKTASAALDLGGVAEVLSRLSGRTTTRVTITDDEWKAAEIGRGLQPMVADFSLGMFQASRRGEFDVVNPTLETIIGHPHYLSSRHFSYSSEKSHHIASRLSSPDSIP